MSAFWASWTLCYICWVRHVLTLALLFKSLKIPDGYQIASLEELGLWSTSQLSLWIGVFAWRSELPFRCLYSEVIIFILICYVFKHCLFVLPLFVAICEIWLPELTYGVYLVLFLKPSATINCCLMEIFIFLFFMVATSTQNSCFCLVQCLL